MIKRDIMSIKYCPTEDMMADYMTKPLVGFKLHYFRAWIMNLPQYPELASRSVLANRRQKARVEVVEEIRTKNKKSGNKKMTTINQGAVESKRSEPKKMTYLEALKKTKTKDNDHEQTTIKTKIRKLG